MENNKELTAEELKEINGGSIEDDEAEIARKDIENAINFIKTEYPEDIYFQALVIRLEMAITWIKLRQYRVALGIITGLIDDKEFTKRDTTGCIWNFLYDAQWYL